jgi:hypothetical protein
VPLNHERQSPASKAFASLPHHLGVSGTHGPNSSRKSLHTAPARLHQKQRFDEVPVIVTGFADRVVGLQEAFDLRPLCVVQLPSCPHALAAASGAAHGPTSRRGRVQAHALVADQSGGRTVDHDDLDGFVRRLRRRRNSFDMTEVLSERLTKPRKGLAGRGPLPGSIDLFTLCEPPGSYLRHHGRNFHGPAV